MPEKNAENKPKTIDEFIMQYSQKEQDDMQLLRKTITAAAPKATEKISWGMPTFYLNGNLVHFAPGKNHYGFYPGASGVEKFLPKLNEYKTSKGAIQFPKNKPLPLGLITEIVEFRVKENTQE